MTEFRPTRFEILPAVVKNILIINVLVALAQYALPQSGLLEKNELENLFALHTFQSELFKPWQFITHMFMHAGPSHIFGNMLALWMFGSVLENLWGPKRFLIFYMASGLGAALCHMLVLYYQNDVMINAYNSLTPNTLGAFLEKYNNGINLARFENPAEAALIINLSQATLGASGAVFGCLAAFGYLFPNTYIYIYFAIPIKAKWFVILYAALELYLTIRASAGDNVAHIAHLGGALVGIILVILWNKKNRKTFY